MRYQKKKEIRHLFININIMLVLSQIMFVFIGHKNVVQHKVCEFVCRIEMHNLRVLQSVICLYAYKLCQTSFSISYYFQILINRPCKICATRLRILKCSIDQNSEFSKMRLTYNLRYAMNYAGRPVLHSLFHRAIY